MNSILYKASGYAQLFWPTKNALIWQDKNPVRAELFSVERLEQHAVSLATEQRIASKPKQSFGWRTWQSPLHQRLDSNATVLLKAYRASAAELTAGHSIVPAAEWLLDNYHLVDQQIREIYDDLPLGFYRQLPKLQQGPFSGYPRVFAIAWAFIAHTDSHFDPLILQRFLNAYQQVDVLTIGELWAVAITLRIVLIENLRRLTDQISLGLTDRAAADQLADQLLKPGAGQQALQSYINQLTDKALSFTFAAQLAKRLRGQDPHSTPALQWLEQRLSRQQSSIELVVINAQQRLGASNVSVRNVMTSMRRISAIDWAELFEQVSPVDRHLCQHSNFAAMDFSSRNMYRTAIEQLARGANLPECDVARAATEIANARDRTQDDEVKAACEADAGYYLIGDGRTAFEHRIGFQPDLALKLHRAVAATGLFGYLSLLWLFSLALLALVALLLPIEPGYTMAVVLLLLAILPASELASHVLQCFITHSTAATLLPALDFATGVPLKSRTLVVIPCLLTNAAETQELVSRLEVHYLASGSKDLSFALLTDGVDATEQNPATDIPLLQLASQLIAQLNQSYAPDQTEPMFLLLHRRRLWNDKEQKWMGWERKRGKLVELNHLLRGATDTSFTCASTELPLLSTWVPSQVRYVITLDADTQLPRDTAIRLIGKLAHPLNCAQFCPQQQRVTSGYGILQPRVTPALASGLQNSAYQRLYSGPAGLDPYAAAVSDLYQDLFAEGSFTGKGIYDVDAFEQAMAARVADNTLLSHDLFEGIVARAALVSDIEVIEDFPARYDVAVKRQQRWTRGDWQLLPWLLKKSKPTEHASPVSAPLPSLGRWKILDNLRRSLVQPCCFFLLLLAGFLPLSEAFYLVLLVSCYLILPRLLPCSLSLLPHRKGIQWHNHLNNLRIDFSLALSAGLLNLVFLADQSWRMLQAITVTLYRVGLSKRHLLQWTTAAQNQRDSSLTLSYYYWLMAPALLATWASFGLMLWFGSSNWQLFLPLLLVWSAAPAIALLLSKPFARPAALQLSEQQAWQLRLIARRTWRYFERFVTAEDHHLPPDNFQQQPQPAIAHRTSPTNIGMYLLSIAAARDFGWLATGQAIQRLQATFATLQQLRTCHGHFFNWYDTRDLRPLEPVYVSSVDSGNLAGHLIALANACDEWQGQLSSPQARNGLSDTLALAQLSLQQAPALLLQSQSGLQLQAILTQLDKLLRHSDSLLQPESLTELCHQALSIASARQTATFQRETKEQRSAQHSLVFYLQTLQQSLTEHLAQQQLNTAEQQQQILQLQQLAQQSRHFAMAMNFAFFMDAERNLLSIGYAVEENRLDTSCYDLLASEARLASLFAVAKGDADTKHWFRLGRSATPLGYGSALLSWSGSMFEYLMPSLVMSAASGSLLEQSNRLMVARQISYGRQLGIPWGISESAYNARDMEFTYQYSNFGVPGLGLKRGLAENKVIAPYATALATMVDPIAAVINFDRLTQIGALADYGFFEAIDYTQSRLPDGTTMALVQSFMAHHQGMSIVAILNTLQQGVMRQRFHREPMIQACELLLQERLPRYVAIAHPKAEEVSIAASSATTEPLTERRLDAAAAGPPCSHLLSNGSYSVMLTAAGAGYSRWRSIAITRWREDSSRDPWGAFVLLRDKQSNHLWSSTLMPVLPERAVASSDQSIFSKGTAPLAVFSEDHAEFIRQQHDLTCTVEVVVSTEHQGEVRRVSLINHSKFSRDIELTSYAELVLAAVSTDNAHPAFAKLFVQTEFVAEYGALFATRRVRSADETAVFAAHFSVVEGEICAPLQYETNRALFFGQGQQLEKAAALQNKALTNSSGTVLDAIFSLRQSIRIAPSQVCRVAFWTLVASSRQELLDLVDQHNERSAYDRACTLAWTQAQVQLRHLAINVAEAADFQRLTGPLLYNDLSFRASAAAISRGAGSQAGLWQHAISGDAPIVLLHIDDIEDMAVVQQLLRAHEYWRMKQLAVDLVIVNERASSYIQDLQSAIETQVRSSQSKPNLGLRMAAGSVFCLRADLMTVESRALLAAVARVVLYANRGSLASQLSRMPAAAPQLQLRKLIKASAVSAPVEQPEPSLQFFNGLGGFHANGREYHTYMQNYQRPPMPWINVIANPNFGFQVSTLGSGFSWAENSRENQLTPWSNDPVTDPCGEAFYLQDQDSAELFSPTAQPLNDGGFYRACHGFGYSSFDHQAAGIGMQLLQYVPVADPIKISRLTLTNGSDRIRHLTVTAFTEWVLGRDRSASSAFLQSRFDEHSQTMLVCNPWSTAFVGRHAFATFFPAEKTTGATLAGWTADRTEFIGRNGNLTRPLALVSTEPLAKRSGAGLDPCTALQMQLSLAPGEQCELVFLLGQTIDNNSALALVQQYQQLDLDDVLQQVKNFWHQKLDAVQVQTPDPAMNIMLNGWLLYQTIVCRLYARAAFYQASGAYGFRDQLQDSMALSFADPAFARQHLLKAAGRQFIEGDVQHWWLPHSGAGVRSRISDDKVWLAFACAHYINSSGDLAVLAEQLPFLQGPPLSADQHDAFYQPMPSDHQASLFEHCARGLDLCIAQTGELGLPLMGSGDWNDGMDLVGAEGKGQSVWLGWLVLSSIQLFLPFVPKEEQERADRWQHYAKGLTQALEQHAWDGEWYKRATFDQGSWLGSKLSPECKIDSIAQSWAVLSGAARPNRTELAMASVSQHLIKQQQGLALLFSPPFEHIEPNPGYIKGYPAGLRENGGQYSHAAMWAVFAFARLQQADKAVELFSLLNPIHHALTPDAVARYQTEPYVVAADIYSVAPHQGRGGWSWYTGAAAWMYRSGLEAILGLSRQGNWIQFAPCIPHAWPGFSIKVSVEHTSYQLELLQHQAVASITLDGIDTSGDADYRIEGVLKLPLDGKEHHLRWCVAAKQQS